jgi:hypothetical protein
MGTIRATGLDHDWKRTVLVSTAKKCIDETKHLSPLRRISACSFVPDEDELPLDANSFGRGLTTPRGRGGAANVDACSGRLRIGFTGNFSLGNQPIVKVVTVLAATLFKY